MAQMQNTQVAHVKLLSKQLSIEPVPTELQHRNELRVKLLKPQVKSWAAGEARLEEKRARFDTAELEGAIRQHLAGSAAAQKGAPNAAMSEKLNSEHENEVAQLEVYILLQMVADGEKDLSEQMQQAQEQMAAKQQLREQMNELQQQLAEALRSAPASERNGTCKRVICTSVPGKVAEINAAVKKLKPASVRSKFNPQKNYVGVTEQQGRVTLDSDGVTQQQMNQWRTGLVQLGNDLDSDNEFSEQESTNLQLLLDARTKLLRAASEIEKSKSDADAALVQNIKQ